VLDLATESLPALAPSRPYSQTQLAKVLGVSHKTVARWRIRGIQRPGRRGRACLPCYRAGGKWMVTGAEALGFLRVLSLPAAEVSSSADTTRRRRLPVDEQLDEAGF